MTSAHTRALPGDFTKHTDLARALRIDHAGEYGAKRIYAGQLAVLKDAAVGPTIAHMAEQEEKHLAAFNKLLPEHRVRPSALMPLWHVAGYALGAATAMLGPRAAMACTVAVEDVITEHYTKQLSDPAIAKAGLTSTIEQFRNEELEHHDTGLEHDAASAPMYGALTGAIKIGCRAAIWLAARI